MTRAPKTIHMNERLVVGEELMQKEKIKELNVVDDAQRVVGVLQIFDTE
jgi:arabinose-5-phosphate isomerase